MRPEDISSARAHASPASSLNRGDRHAMTEAARLFYLQDVSKKDIALQLGISRFRVARLLTQARETGLVTISIHDVAPVDERLSRQLSDHWGVSAVVVRCAGAALPDARVAVGQAAAELFMDVVTEDEIVGLAWGRTLAAMTDYLTLMPRLSIVQLTGAVTSDIDASPVELIRRACLSTGGRAYPIIAPAIVGDAAALAALKEHPDVRAAVVLFDHITTAFISVGSWDSQGSQIFAILPPSESQRLTNMGVSAEVSGVFFDQRGHIVAEDLSERYLSISANQLRRVPRVVAAAGGLAKLAATRSVVQSGLITDLVTDHTLAEAALVEPSVRPLPNPDRMAS